MSRRPSAAAGWLPYDSAGSQTEGSASGQRGEGTHGNPA